MYMVVEQNVHESVQISLTDRPAKNSYFRTGYSWFKQTVESQSKEAEFHSPSDQLKENDDNAAATEVVEMKDATTEPKLQGTVAVLNEELVKETSQSTSDSPPSAHPVTPPKEPSCSPGTAEKDVGMVDMNNENDTQQ
ncbi:hypothetical protein OIU85_012894 [Salix viminalis]|uniref:Uncharacterized protein n=1 Tax=Salix viminalis TaxID=40686 RepID=A0A9Q0NQ71_SALVM|nr:hypothetical protein OIU85_012894 [Salix viminalis]